MLGKSNKLLISDSPVVNEGVIDRGAQSGAGVLGFERSQEYVIVTEDGQRMSPGLIPQGGVKELLDQTVELLPAKVQSAEDVERWAADNDRPGSCLEGLIGFVQAIGTRIIQNATRR